MIKEILKADLDIKHLILPTIIFCFVAYITMSVLFPLSFMLMYGSGVSADKLSNTVLAKTLWLLSGVIILTPMVVFRVVTNFKKGNVPKAKVYVFAILNTLLFSILFYFWYNQATTTE